MKHDKYEMSAEVYQSIKRGENKYKVKSDYQLVIGIDPDVEKNGIAIYAPFDKSLQLYNWYFFELYDNLKTYKQVTDEKILLVIEAGYLNKSNWHVHSKQKKSLVANIGQRTGANHQVAIMLAQMAEYLEIDYKLVKPTKSKMNSDTFKKITGYKKLSNQEQRDAAILVWGY